MLRNLLGAIIVALLSTGTSLADTLYGTCVRKDGSKVDGTAKITTSWNNKYAVPRHGKYRLDFGGAVGKKITVYVDGKRYRAILVKGNTKLNIVIK